MKGFLPGEDVEQVGVYEGKNLHAAATSPKLPLAMKLVASRPERDLDDIKSFYEFCGLTTAEEGLAVFTSFNPQEQVVPRVQFLLQEMFPDSLHLSRDDSLSH